MPRPVRALHCMDGVLSRCEQVMDGVMSPVRALRSDLRVSNPACDPTSAGISQGVVDTFWT